MGIPWEVIKAQGLPLARYPDRPLSLPLNPKTLMKTFVLLVYPVDILTAMCPTCPKALAADRSHLIPIIVSLKEREVGF